MLKERIIVGTVRRRARRGELRERVLLAGVPEDIAALERSFTPDQKLLDGHCRPDRYREAAAIGSGGSVA